MKHRSKLRKTVLALGLGTALLSGPVFAQAGAKPPTRPAAGDARPAETGDKPNILFIMGDDIGWMQPSIYHRGLMVGETPNIDRIGHEGAIFMDYVAMQSCTSGRNAFFTGMYPLRTGMIPPQLPGSPSYLRPGTPALAKFLHDLGYTTGEFGKNHLGDHTAALPTAHGFQEYWGYLYHLDAMQQVSFPDINKSPTEQGVAPPCKNTPIPGVPEVPGAVDPKTTICLTPPRPVLWCNSSDGTEKNQTCKDEGPLTLERSKTVDEEISAKVIDFLDRNDPKKTNKPFFVWYNPARMHVTTMLSPKYDGHDRREGRQGLGPQRSRHEAARRQHRLRPQEARGHGPARQHHRRLHHGQRRRGDLFPRRRHHAVQGPERRGVGRRLPRAAGGPLAGPHQAGHGQEPAVRRARLGADAGRHRRRPQGRRAEEADRGGQDTPASSRRRSTASTSATTSKASRDKSARDIFFYYSGATPSAVRYKNWKMYYTMSQPGPAGWIMPLVPFHFTLVQNIKRDPFEQAVGLDQKTALAWAARSASPSTAYLYDWNMLPIGQQLWEKHLMSYEKFPPLQAPETYNLGQILEAVKKAHASHPSD